MAVEVARLKAEGQIHWVPREGEWQSLAASLIERRLRWSPDGESCVRVESRRFKR